MLLCLIVAVSYSSGLLYYRECCNSKHRLYYFLRLRKNFVSHCKLSRFPFHTRDGSNSSNL
jgi:hypothetical protein